MAETNHAEGSNRTRSPGPVRQRRNTRPRDRLGRPLPYGATGVERQPEGVARTPSQVLLEGQRLLTAGMPFHAHEVFEDAWKTAPDAERELWRGLAQLAVGLTHAARGNQPGAVALLRRGAATITPYVETKPHGLDVAAVLRWAELAAQQVSEAAALPSAPPLTTEQ